MKYLCKVAYDGSHFFGFQRQKTFKTVQGEIELALKKIYGKQIDIHSSSRTDTGVHALGQIFHYETDIIIPIEKLNFIIDRHLCEEISVLNIITVNDDFHARYNTVEKTYRYDIMLSKAKQIFKSRYALIYKKEIDLEYMKKACKIFIGKRDYAALMASGSYKENTVRDIKSLQIIQKSDDLLSIYISSDGFLYHMVRIIVGALLDCNEGRKTIDDLLYGLENKDRNVFRRTAPACGLYLEKINYIL